MKRSYDLIVNIYGLSMPFTSLALGYTSWKAVHSCAYHDNIKRRAEEFFSPRELTAWALQPGRPGVRSQAFSSAHGLG